MKILITRSGINIIDLNTYNCQELGLAKALARRGHKVYITTPDHYEDHTQVRLEGCEPIDIYRLKLLKINQLLCWHRHLWRVLDEIQPDIIHLNGFRSTVCLGYSIWKKKHRCKAVMIEGMYRNTSKAIIKPLQLLFINTLGKYVLNNMDGYGCKTFWAGEYVKTVKNVDVTHTPIGLDEDKFSNYNVIDWRSKLGLEDKKVLLYIGVQEPRRNPDFLVRIMKQLPEEYVLLMVGSGPMVHDVNNLIDDYQLKERVIQLGKLPQSDLPSLYMTSDLFLLPSSFEIYGMVLLESMYFGLPVISTLTAGSDCLIQTGVDGIILKNLNIEQWVSSINSICDTPELRLEMGEKAKRKIKQSFVWDRTVDSFLSLYFKALSLH